MNACPKCGGTTGFSYNLVMKTQRTGDWGKNDDEEVDIEKTYFPKTVTCNDCGKRVEFEAAHGEEEVFKYVNQK